LKNLAMDANSSTHQQICFYDTTLRDGAQQAGISLSVEDKLKVAHLLDNLGIPFIEGGWPGANPKDARFFERLKESPLQSAEVVTFCSTRRPGILAAEEALFQPILVAQTKWVTLFGKSWDLHVTESLKTSLNENLAMIADSIAFLRAQGRRVIYDAEHWFDGYKHNAPYALETLKEAIAAGADWIVLCDTNGGTLPHEIQAIVGAVGQHLAAIAPDVQLGIHAHNDSGMAVANSLIAVQHGVRMVQGTMNGYGERCGNANLCTLIPNLQLKLSYQGLTPKQLTELTPTSRLLSEIVNLAPQEQAPFVGASAFAHKGGIHVSAVQRNATTYEHIDPQAIGNHRRIVVSEQSGISNVLQKANQFGFNLEKTNPASRQILAQLKQLESEGYQFEAAEASFELLIREALGHRPIFFELKGFDIYGRGQQQGSSDILSSSATATVKVWVNEQEMLTAAEGNGPVSALDAALRKALVQFYPIIAEFQLTDYKVRILDGSVGTAAKTRVLVESSNGQERWTTVGVSTNIIDASYQAVAQGIEYGLLWNQTHQTQIHSELRQFCVLGAGNGVK
jgi:2-isopropylmalate synthase